MKTLLKIFLVSNCGPMFFLLVRNSVEYVRYAFCTYVACEFSVVFSWFDEFGYSKGGVALVTVSLYRPHNYV